MQAPRVSIIIPVFNTEKYVADAIRSVLAQQYANIEIIVVDDGSTDTTLQTLHTFGDSIKVLHFEKNAGPAAARNAGLAHATGSIIGFLDADDMWFPDALKHLLPSLTEESYDFVRGLTQFFKDRNGNRTLLENLVPNIHMGASLYKKEVLTKVGNFDEGLKYGEDMDWDIRLKEARLRGKNVPFPVLQYRRHETNMTNDEAKVKASILEVFRKKFLRARLTDQRT